MVEALKHDYREAKLAPSDRALMDYVVKVTREPWNTSAEDIETLRGQGFEDDAIHDAVQVASYFNYINRVADALGIDLEDWMPPEPKGWKRDWS